MKSILNLIFLTLLLSASTTFAQEVRVLKGLKKYSGEVAEWGVKKQNGIYPAKGWIFYGIDQVALVIVPQKEANPKGLKAFMIRNPEIQKQLFGTTYTEYARKKKKKKKGGASGIVIRCESKSDCSGNCGAVFSTACDGCPETFIRCAGNCCGGPRGTHIPKTDSGRAFEFIF